MEYKHFSHHHNLNIFKVQEGQQCICQGCKSPCYDSIYACWHCKFFLHEHCGNATRYVKHPSHPLHPLILLPTPTYCSGSFLCNACGAPGGDFSYSCALCEVDLHLNCAFLPPKVTHKSHQHELMISYDKPPQKGSHEFCKICTRQLGLKDWSYNCAKEDCDFRVHTFCATTEVKPGIYQGGDDSGSDSEIPSTSSSGTNQNDSGCNANQVQPTVADIMQLQAQMQMAEQLAQMMATFNISHLV